MERTRSETLKLFVVSDVGPRSTLLSSTPSTRWWQSSWPRSDAPSPAGGPWSAKRCRTLETDRVCSRPRSPRLKQILQIVIAVSVQSADGALFLHSFELPVNTSVISAALCLDAKSAVRPQLPL